MIPSLPVKVPTDRLPWWEPEFAAVDAEAVAAVVRGGWINEGPRTAAFTRRVADDLGCRHVRAAPSGTTALFLALRACGVGAGDEVIVPDLTFVATSSAVRLCGATAVPVDVRPADLTLDAERVPAVISPRTAAIVPVHLGGRPADIAALRATVADRPRRIPIVADACQALGSRVGGRALGTLADAGCYSLAPTKVITSGQGGLVVTDRDDIAAAVTRLKDHGRRSRDENAHPTPGFNFKLSDILAALADAQWDRLAARLAQLRAQFARYREALREAPGVDFRATDLDAGVVPLWVDVYAERAGPLRAALAARGVSARPFWPPLHTQAADRAPGPFPVADRAAARGLWLPSGPARTPADVDRVVDAVWAAARQVHGRVWS